MERTGGAEFVGFFCRLEKGFIILKKFFSLKFENLNLDILIKYNSYKKKGCIRNSQVTYVIAVWKNVVG